MEFARFALSALISNSSVEDDLPAGIEFSNISPNPANSLIQLNITNSFDINAKVEIMNYSGELIKALGFVNLNSGENHYTADVSELINGKYLLIFKSDKFTLTRELIINR